MIEAAIVGRPVCSVLAPEFAGTQEGTIHFHYLVPEHGGFVRIAATLEQHVAHLSECLKDPRATRAQIAQFVASFIRPHGVDRPATPIFAETVCQLASTPAPMAEHPPAWRFFVRPFVLAAAVPAVWIDRFSDGAYVLRARKRLDNVARRVRKRLARVGARWKRYFEEAW